MEFAMRHIQSKVLFLLILAAFTYFTVSSRAARQSGGVQGTEGTPTSMPRPRAPARARPNTVDPLPILSPVTDPGDLFSCSVPPEWGKYVGTTPFVAILPDVDGWANDFALGFDDGATMRFVSASSCLGHGRPEVLFTIKRR